MYVQADLWLCWSHIPHCWKSHVAAHMYIGACEKIASLCRLSTQKREFYVAKMAVDCWNIEDNVAEILRRYLSWKLLEK